MSAPSLARLAGAPGNATVPVDRGVGMGKHPREGRISYVVQEFIPSEPRPGPLAHWRDRLATVDRDKAYALATALGRCRVHEFEVVRNKAGRLVTRERTGSPFKVSPVDA